MGYFVLKEKQLTRDNKRKWEQIGISEDESTARKWSNSSSYRKYDQLPKLEAVEQTDWTFQTKSK